MEVIKKLPRSYQKWCRKKKKHCGKINYYSRSARCTVHDATGDIWTLSGTPKFSHSVLSFITSVIFMLRTLEVPTFIYFHRSMLTFLLYICFFVCWLLPSYFWLLFIRVARHPKTTYKYFGVWRWTIRNLWQGFCPACVCVCGCLPHAGNTTHAYYTLWPTECEFFMVIFMRNA